MENKQHVRRGSGKQSYQTEYSSIFDYTNSPVFESTEQ